MIRARDLPPPVRVGLVKARGRTDHRPSRGMNGLERDWSIVLEARRRAGEVLRWDYEPERLKLADGTFYAPDFRVQLANGTIEFHECKGFMRDDAAAKLKIAAALHPYTFRLVTRKRGAWTVVEV